MHDALLERLVAIQPGGGDTCCLGDRLEINGALLFQEISNGCFGPTSGIDSFLLCVCSQTIHIAFPRSRHHLSSSCPSASRAAMSVVRAAIICSLFSRNRTYPRA